VRLSVSLGVKRRDKDGRIQPGRRANTLINGVLGTVQSVVYTGVDDDEDAVRSTAENVVAPPSHAPGPRESSFSPILAHMRPCTQDIARPPRPPSKTFFFLSFVPLEVANDDQRSLISAPASSTSMIDVSFEHPNLGFGDVYTKSPPP
jgi:hypothetical protein